MLLDSVPLSPSERRELERLLSLAGHRPPTLEEVWHLMDVVWDELDCDNRNPDGEKVGVFYRHPIWILNGLFIEQDPVSMQHRHSITRWVHDHTETIASVVDYGGGFGTLARLIAEQHPCLHVDILDPYPSAAARAQTEPIANIAFVDEVNKPYDCLVSTDVLEHVPDPLASLAEMIDAVRPGGYLIIANHFAPTIKCHLPATFHLRYTFNVFTKCMGLTTLGRCAGSHATIYQKTGDKPISWPLVRAVEQTTRVLHPALNVAAVMKSMLSL